MPLLDEAVVNKAVRALLKFHENQRLRKGGGGEPDAMISLQLGLRKVPDASGQAKPLRIAILFLRASILNSLINAQQLI